jgi:hypothetical protein
VSRIPSGARHQPAGRPQQVSRSDFVHRLEADHGTRINDEHNAPFPRTVRKISSGRAQGLDQCAGEAFGGGRQRSLRLLDERDFTGEAQVFHGPRAQARLRADLHRRARQNGRAHRAKTEGIKSDRRPCRRCSRRSGPRLWRFPITGRWHRAVPLVPAISAVPQASPTGTKTAGQPIIEPPAVPNLKTANYA